MTQAVFPEPQKRSLTIWRGNAADALFLFDFRAGDYGVRWRSGLTKVQYFTTANDAPSVS